MAFLKKRNKKQKEVRPIVVDDYIYNDPEDADSEDSIASDTPDEAIRKLRGRSAEESSDSGGSILRIPCVFVRRDPR